MHATARLTTKGAQMSQYVAIGTQLLASPSSPDVPDPWDAPEAGQVPLPGRDGTLLAVVPIPGTQTSLAIVGYAVPAPSAQAPDRNPDTAELVLDQARRRVLIGGREIPLTFQEFELLAFLSAHPSTVFTRAELVRQVWQRDFESSSRTVDVHISRLRHKLGPAYGQCLVTEYRVGYQFRPLAS
jgi:Transcriptional regulatory protein, C terminal